MHTILLRYVGSLLAHLNHTSVEGSFVMQVLNVGGSLVINSMLGGGVGGGGGFLGHGLLRVLNVGGFCLV